MTNTDYTAIVFLADRSGSMTTIASDIVGGVKTLLKNQTELPGKCTVDVVLFDHEYEETHHLADPQDVNFVLEPRGMTALYDAAGTKINTFGKALSEMSEEDRPSKVLFVIASDGLDNRSREFTAYSLGQLISKQRDQYNWDFVYLGTNQDAVTTAKGLNIDPKSALTFVPSATGVQASLGSLNAYTASYRSAGAAAFSDKDRSAAVN